MRVKDETKQRALFDATVKVVNEIGFASSSVSRITKEAGVSPATIYIYHKNKEDLIVSTYVEIKKNFGQALLADFDDKLPIRDVLKGVWARSFDYVTKHRADFNFAEQFANSPFSDLVDRAAVEKYFEPIVGVITSGVQQKIIKDVSLDLIGVFVFYPILLLSNKRHCSNFEITKQNVGRAFDMAWDAIRR